MNMDTHRVALKLRALSDLLISAKPVDLAPETISEVGLIIYDFAVELDRKIEAED